MLVSAAVLLPVWAIVLLLRRAYPALDAFLDAVVRERDPQLAASATSSREARSWFLAGLLFTCAALTFLEISRPYYFVQDDVLVGDFPSILWQCRSVWKGVIPEYDPYLMMGCPRLSEGVGTYPPTYLAYAVARHVLGNEYATMDVFAILHIMAGYVAAFWAFRRVGMGAMPACAASLCFVHSGSILILGRSWHTFVPLAIWLPLLVAAVHTAGRGPVSWRWLIGVALLVGIVYHIGFPQTWAHFVAFLVLGVLWQWFMGRIPLRRVFLLAFAVLLGFSLAMPLFYVQWQLSLDMDRLVSHGDGIRNGLLALVIPYPFVQAELPSRWGCVDTQYGGHLYYFGTLFVVLLLLNVLALATKRHSRLLWSSQVWTVCACVAFIVALQRPISLTLLIQRLPLVGNHLFRLLPFFVLFTVLAGGLVLERLLCRTARRRIAEMTVGVLLCIVLANHLWFARSSFYTYGFLPYPKLPDGVTDLLGPSSDRPNSRFASWTPERSMAPDYFSAMPHNLPAVYEIPTFWGYDLVVDSKQPLRSSIVGLTANPTAAARAYGIRWFLKHRTCSRPVLSSNPHMHELENAVEFAPSFEKIRFTKLHRLPGVDELEILELQPVDPLAFRRREPNVALPLRVDGAGIDVDVGGSGSACSVVVNFAWYPDMRAEVDGREVECRRDDWYRILVEVPAGATRLELRYEAPWRQGFFWSGVMATMALAGAYVLQRTRPAPPVSPGSP